MALVLLEAFDVVFSVRCASESILSRGHVVRASVLGFRTSGLLGMFMGQMVVSLVVGTW